MLKKLVGLALAAGGAIALGAIALHRGEPINALWLLAAGLCIYTLGYRFYAAWIAASVLMVDGTRATPAERLDNGRDFHPTPRWVVFGHHFAAIAGPGPLVGPTLAAQFGYLPGTLWILIGSVIGGCVQDMVVLFASTRRDGRTLGQMARDELGPIGGTAALVGTLAIMVILIAVLSLVVVNAMKHSPWATSTVFATIPIAVIVGIYMRHLRPGQVIEGSLLGVALLIAAVVGGGWIDHQPDLRGYFDHDGTTLAWFVMGYGFIAAILPVWLLLAPRDYLSTYLKLGVVVLLAVAIVVIHPELRMPALTRFVDGTGPVFAGKLFPFVFITIACGAISGFHSLISSGTTPKLLRNERDIRLVGYGSMALESLVAIMAMIAATLLEPGVYFAINSPLAALGGSPEAVVTTLSQWGFPVTLETMQSLAKQVGESTLFARTGGAPSLAVGMASILSSTFGSTMIAIWYHFAIMFEAIFILTTLDAGTRVGRFMLQDTLSHLWKPLGRTSWYPSVVLTSGLIVAAWGYFLYVGVTDPNGGINILWPLFGISNQMLAAIALSVMTAILLKGRKPWHALVTAVPLLWLAVVTSCAAWLKIMSDNPKIGFIAGAHDLSAKLAAGTLPPEKAAVASKLIFNQQLDAVLAGVFLAILWLVILDVAMILVRRLRNEPIQVSPEASYVRSVLPEATHA
jgi:carbon starvation protein